MLRISRMVPTASRRMTSSPIGPARLPETVSPKLFSANTSCANTPPPYSAVDPLTHAGEQVIFRHCGVDDRAGQLVVLGRPRLELDVHGHMEPEAIRVDLGGVCAQRVVAQLEEVSALDACRD